MPRLRPQLPGLPQAAAPRLHLLLAALQSGRGVRLCAHHAKGLPHAARRRRRARGGGRGGGQHAADSAAVGAAAGRQQVRRGRKGWAARGHATPCTLVVTCLRAPPACLPANLLHEPPPPPSLQAGLGGQATAAVRGGSRRRRRLCRFHVGRVACHAVQQRRRGRQQPQQAAKGQPSGAQPHELRPTLHGPRRWPASQTDRLRLDQTNAVHTPAASKPFDDPPARRTNQPTLPSAELPHPHRLLPTRRPQTTFVCAAQTFAPPRPLTLSLAHYPSSFDTPHPPTRPSSNTPPFPPPPPPRNHRRRGVARATPPPHPPCPPRPLYLEPCLPPSLPQLSAPAASLCLGQPTPHMLWLPSAVPRSPALPGVPPPTTCQFS